MSVDSSFPTAFSASPKLIRSYGGRLQIINGAFTLGNRLIDTFECFFKLFSADGFEKTVLANTGSVSYALAALRLFSGGRTQKTSTLRESAPGAEDRLLVTPNSSAS